MLHLAKWIGCGEDAVTPYIHKTFTLNAPKKGEIDVTGLGFFKLWINGKSVSDELCNPSPSHYEKRDLTKFGYPIYDEIKLRIYYRHYDISDLLEDGENQITVMLGNGWYRQKERVAEGNVSFGEALKAIFAISAEDANGKQMIVSDGSETYTHSHIIYSNLFVGEIHDARLLGVQGEHYPVTVLPDAEAELTLQDCPSDRVIRTIKPELIAQKENKKIYHVKENITGRVNVLVKAAEGESVAVRCAEELYENGELNFVTAGSPHICTSGRLQIQEDIFIGDGKEHRMAPEFCWHCFQYFEIEGEGYDPIVEVIHTDLPVTSRFDSGSEALNWLYEAYIRTQLDNIHGCIPSDCPQRERLGYLGDAQVSCACAMMMLDCDKSYRKWMQDILDGQDPKTGHIQHTAPFMGGGGGPGGWGGAVVVVPYRHYRQFGDLDFVAHCYPAMVKWVSYMESRSEDHLVMREEDGGWCLGDWASVGTLNLPVPFANTCYFVDALQKMAFMADELGKPEEASLWREKAAIIKDALKRHYYDEETGSFCHGIQGADAHALYIGMNEDPRTLENLSARYQSLGYFDTGYFGTDQLVDVLFKNGYDDIAYKLLCNENEGGYLWMKRVGSTTVWEFLGRQFGEINSRCHPMFCGPARQLFTSVLGIGQPDGKSGYREVTVSPHYINGLPYADGAVTLNGKILSVKWVHEQEQIRVTICVPEGLPVTYVHGDTVKPLSAGVNEFIA